jgi:hypothetical protein
MLKRFNSTPGAGATRTGFIVDGRLGGDLQLLLP